MKKTGRFLSVFFMAIWMTCMTANEVSAGAQVYITFSIGGGVFIGVIGIGLQAVFLHQIAREQEEQKKMAASDSSIEKSDEPDPLPLQADRADRASASLNPAWENSGTMRSDFELNLFTFRW